MLLRAGYPGRTTRRRVATAGPLSPPTVHAAVASGATGGAISADFTGQGHVSGDLLLIARMTANQPTGGTVPPTGGWAEVSNSPQGVGTAGAATGVALNVYWKISDGTETTVGLGDSGDINSAWAVVVKGNNASPINATAGDTDSSGTTSRTLPGVTTTIDNCLVLFFAATDRDGSGSTWSAQTNANLTTTAEVFDSGTPTNSGGGLMLWRGVMATAGATGGTTATVSSSENTAHVTVAVRP